MLFLLMFPRSWHSPHQSHEKPGTRVLNNKRKRGVLRISSISIHEWVG